MPTMWKIRIIHPELHPPTSTATKSYMRGNELWQDETRAYYVR
jgi:hypothetical protein